MARRSCAWAIVAVLLFAIAFSMPTFAQVGATGATVIGTVKDASGGAVAKATITLRDVGTNRAYTATSNDSGLYIVAGVLPGTYELTAEASGFAKFAQAGIVLTVGQTANVDVGLKVASGEQNVTVTTETPVIEPTKTEISQVIQPQQVESLPISNRLFTDFALLTPGVATSRTSLGATFTDFQTTQISFGGMRSFSNEIMVDGADFISMHTGVQRVTPPQESVQEFRVVNNGFGAEYGRAAGGIVNIVTKSGTNNIHGDVYEYFQNSAMDARGLLQPAPLPHELRQNSFGGSLGGPIKKDKSFFFLNYEGKRRGESPSYPPDLIGPSFTNLQLIDDAKKVMGLAPEGCFTGLSSCTASDQSYIDGFLKTDNEDTGFARFDEQLGANNHLGIRYNIGDIRADGELVGQTLDGGGIGVPSGGRNLLVRDQALFGTLDTTISSNLINSALVQWARRHYNFPGATGQPDFSITNDLELGHNFGTDDQKYESRAQFGDSLSWIKGTHVMKFGFDGNYIKDSDTFPGFTPVRAIVPSAGPNPVDCLANFAWVYGKTYSVPIPADVDGAGNPATTGCPVAGSSFQPGHGDDGVVFTYAGTPLPTSPTACSATSCTPLVTVAGGNPLNTSTWANAFPPSLFGNYTHVINHGYWGFFAQDSWRVTPKFTLNYGLRWDFESGLSQYVKNDFRGVQPRLGFAYSPDSKTVIRAGFGLFFDRYDMTFFFVPNTQKVVAGYLCGNNAPASIASACQAAGILPQNLTGIASGQLQASQGYQLFGFPASQGAASIAANIINTGGYDGIDGGHIEMAGTCVLNGACGVGSGGMDQNSKLPYAEQGSLEIDRQFGGGFALSLSYLFVAAHHLVRGNNINIPCPVGTTKTGTPTDPLTLGPGGPPEWVPGFVNPNGSLSACTGVPTPGTGAIAGLAPFFAGAAGSGLQTLSAGLMDYNNDVANAVYHGLNVTGIERISKYFTMTANYTYSHTIDNGNFTTFINLPVNQFDYAAERSNSNQDLRHRFVGNFTANTPTSGWYRNFTLSGIVTVETGRPFTIFYGNDTLGDIAGVATDRVGGAPLTSQCQTVQACSTMIPRNTYYGDGLRTVDLRVSRAFKFRENRQLELAVDAFNLFNRPNVDEVTSVYGSPVFCGTTPVIPQHYEDATSIAIEHGAASMACPVSTNGLVTPGGSFAATPTTTALGGVCTPPNISTSCLFIPSSPNPTFGLPRTMFNPRQLQLSAKFTF